VNRKASDVARQVSSAGKDGVSINPPNYGIDFLDSELSTTAAVSGRAGAIQLKQATGPVLSALAANAARAESTGYLPSNLKAGIEHLSGVALDDVKVHYNSKRPAWLQAIAFAQGTNIYLAPRQEKCLPHEAWHVVQQKRGRVKPTDQINGVAINANPGLENEANIMGVKAHRVTRSHPQAMSQAFPGARQSGRHEAWHVVQQREGRVSPTGRIGELPLNDDPKLEREAEQMGQRAGMKVASAPAAKPATASPPRMQAVVQRVLAGLEFTEDFPACMWAFPIRQLHKYPIPQIKYAAAHAPTHLWNVAGQNVSAFTVPRADIGGATNEDCTLFDAGNLELTNDVKSVEWIIKRHDVDRTADALLNVMRDDIRMLFDVRQDLIDKLNTLPNNAVRVLAPGHIATLDLANEAFCYQHAASSKGQAQITIEYSNADTIKRINLLNASKFMTGTKVAEGEDVTRVAGTESKSLRAMDVQRKTSFSRATDMLTYLQLTSQPVMNGAWSGALDADQVAIVKLMVLNDAMATTMTRYDAQVGQGQHKNIQRFFPKSRRDDYVKAMSPLAIDAIALINLRAELLRTLDSDARLLVEATDVTALPLEYTHLNAPQNVQTDIAFHTVTLADLRKKPENLANNFAKQTSERYLKTQVFGANNAVLLSNIRLAIRAYTDTSPFGMDTGHWHTGGVVGAGLTAMATGTVIGTSRGFSKTGHHLGRSQRRGAVYEFRERETAAEEDTRFLNFTVQNGSADLIAALESLLQSA
jgi:hypothetical protein